MYTMEEDGSMQRDPDECPNCGCGLFVQAFWKDKWTS